MNMRVEFYVFLPLLLTYAQMSRPFGVALLIAGYDDKGPQLFFSDPRLKKAFLLSSRMPLFILI